VAGAVLLTSCWEGITRAASATILATRGTVRVKEGLAAQFLSARPGLALGAGAILQSTREAQADLALLPSTLARMAGEGELIIDSVELSKDGNETGDAMLARRVEISLRAGTVFVTHRRPPGAAGSLFVKTPHGIVTANSDCLVCIEANSQRLRVTCARGLVGIAPASGQQALSVDAGSVAELTSQTSSLVAVAADAAGQERVTDVLSAERELLALARAQRNILPR